MIRGRTWLTALVASLAACDYVALSFDGSSGLVVIAISDDGVFPAGGYRIRTRQSGVADRMVAVGPGETVRLEFTSSAPVELTLEAPSSCAVSGANPRVIAPDPGRTIETTFAVACHAQP